MTEFIESNALRNVQVLSSRTNGSGWHGFGGTNHLRFSLSEVNPDKPFYEAEWQKKIFEKVL